MEQPKTIQEVGQHRPVVKGCTLDLHEATCGRLVAYLGKAGT
jgi:hypothetical protein